MFIPPLFGTGESGNMSRSSSINSSPLSLLSNSDDSDSESAISSPKESL